MKRGLALLLPAALAACADNASNPLSQPDVAAPAPLFSAADGQGIPGSYIVVLNEGIDAREIAASAGVNPRHVYEAALNGFAGELNARQLEALQNSSYVEYIEQDGIMTVVTTQSGATWGLDRTDQRALPLSTTFSYNNTGTGVDAYIIDTGMRLSHSEFGGRAVSGYDAVDGGSADDCNGHGTHVGGTVGGSTYGIAKGVKLIAVRVLDCGGGGTTAGVIAGVDWVTSNHAAGKPAVANMSLGGGASTSLDNAVNNSINDGVSYAVAAGNGNIFGIAQDACNGSPSRVANAITVSATSSSDTKASWANYGSCLDIFAPGVSITSAWYPSDTHTNTISGTSMAAPHVAGVAALYLQSNTSAGPATVRNALVNNATAGVVKSAGRKSPNTLLFSNY